MDLQQLHPAAGCLDVMGEKHSDSNQLNLMPDLHNFSITPLGNANVNVPRAQIECQVVESVVNGAVLADFTGANAIIFPGVISTLTAADRQELAQMIANWLVLKKAGLPT